MELSVIETAGLSLETLVESLKKSDKFCSYNQRQQYRIYREIFINCYNFIELFYKALLDEKKINIERLYYKDLMRILIKEKIVTENEKKYIYCVKKVRNRVNHNAYSINEIELLNLFKCLVDIIPKIKDKSEKLDIEKNTYNWIIDEDNLFKILLILKPKIYEVLRAIIIDREGAVRNNNYFLNVTTWDIDGIVKILCEEYNIGEKVEIKRIVELLVKCDYIRDSYDLDEDTGESYINGIIARRVFFNEVSMMNNFIEAEIKNKSKQRKIVLK